MKKARRVTKEIPVKQAPRVKRATRVIPVKPVLKAKKVKKAIRVIKVIPALLEPAAKKAYETASRSNRTIAVLGTSATVRSGAYEREICKYGDFTKIISVACPLFVSLVENGRVGADDAIANIAVREYLAPIIPLSPSAVILGCTHYPLLSEVIAKYLPESELINASEEAVKSLCSLVGEDDVVCGRSGARRFYVSDDPEGFAESGRAFLGHDISDRVNYVNIEEF